MKVAKAQIFTKIKRSKSSTSKHTRKKKTESFERGMAARKRASASTETSNEKSLSTAEKTNHKPQESTDPPIAPPKSAFIFKLALLLLAPYFYLLFYHYKIQDDLKRSILINAVLSLAGFFLTVKMIPVASRYVLRRNLFGYDINKKGTPQGTVKV